MATNRQAIIWKHIQLFILATSFAAATGQELCEECTCDTTLNGVKKLACQPVTKALEELISQIPDEYGELEMRRGNFPTLTNYSFVSLNNLKRLVIDNCNVKTIEVGAFASLKNLEELELKANDFFTLPESVFEDLARLKKLTLADNLLTHLTTDIFVGLTNLEILDVERNFLEDISYDSFSSLTSLKQLMLNKNMISSLPSTIFEFNQQLEEVHLNKNKLQELHPMTFNTTPLLQKVYLEENKITTLSEQLFVGNNEITVVSLTGNLFTCNCEMAGFRLWMELDETLKTAEVNGKCGSPDSLKGTDLLDVPHADLVCTTTTTTTTTAPTSTTTETLHTSFLNITSHSHDGSKAVMTPKMDDETIQIIIGSSAGGLMLTGIILASVLCYCRAKNQNKPRQVKYILKPNTTDEFAKPMDKPMHNGSNIKLVNADAVDNGAAEGNSYRYDMTYKPNILPAETNLDDGLPYGYLNGTYTNRPQTPNTYPANHETDGMHFYNSLSRSMAGSSIGRGGQTPLGTLHRATPVNHTLTTGSYPDHRETRYSPYSMTKPCTSSKEGLYYDQSSYGPQATTLNYNVNTLPSDVYCESTYPGYQSDKDCNGKYSTGSADSGVHSNSPLPKSRTLTDYPYHRDPNGPYCSSKKTIKNETYV